MYIYIYTPYSNIADYTNRVYNPLRESPFFTIILWDFVDFCGFRRLFQQRPDESVGGIGHVCPLLFTGRFKRFKRFKPLQQHQFSALSLLSFLLDFM